MKSIFSTGNPEENSIGRFISSVNYVSNIQVLKSIQDLGNGKSWYDFDKEKKAE